MTAPWNKLNCSSKILQLKGTLNGGQSFRWKLRVKDGVEEWVGVFSSKVWTLRQHEDHILYRINDGEGEKCDTECESMLSRYFRLDFDLEEHYVKWSERDPNFAEAAQKFYGVRILKQDVVENLFSFICSSNNHITRISSMVEKLALFYGEKICDVDDVAYYSFPDVSALSQDGVEKRLRDNGFGYRAKFIYQTACKIRDGGGEKWIARLVDMNYEDAKRELMTLTGIGAKVADCICLMSLGHLGAVPVDTHVYQIAARHYLPKLGKQKTVTEKIYREIGEHFRNLYGPYAGWAHTVLFCADLKKFKSDKETGRKRGHNEK